MKRALVAVLLLGLAVAPLAASEPVQAQSGATTATNNSTVEQLRERVQELENKNADLRAEVVSKNSRIQKLEFQLEQSEKSDQFSGAEASQLKKIGAWNPYEGEPAFAMWVDSEDGGLYQYVGPGNGEHSFNGMEAWSRVLSGDVTLAGNITIDLLYSPPDMKEEIVIESGLNSNAGAEIRQLIDRLNRPATRLAWEQWNNDRRNQAESTENSTTGVVGVVMLTLFGLGAFIESRKDIVKSRSGWKFGRQQSAALDRQRYSRLEDTPVIGWIIRKIREWRRGR